jgi:hypothetical protein
MEKNDIIIFQWSGVELLSFPLDLDKKKRVPAPIYPIEELSIEERVKAEDYGSING